MASRRPPASSRSESTHIGETVPPSNGSSGKLGRGAWLKTPNLLFFHQIPTWQQDNEYILSGYRPTSGSALRSIASLLYLHNQTINAYSHLIGAVIFVALPFYFYQHDYVYQPNARVDDIFVVSVYCLGVAVCFAFSATFHIMWNHSYPLTSLCNKLDYLGILVLMWGAGIPTIYYGFFCNHNLRLLYWTTTSSTALCCAIFTLNPYFGSPQFRRWRACFYAGFGLSSIIFIIHGLMLHGWERQKSHMSLVWMGWMATSNLVGAAIYAARIPERWAPYRFDILGASHQIFHVAVMIAAWIHFCGLLEAFHGIRSRHDSCSNI
ncbi:putative hemolysin-III channel protein Izh2 [Hypoxylon rubiginosum]|uniref:Hemolysin-III channel protein Izh2 n=1 Tax=Hypoxylon rubiginosum TaxID=110542 RepID=A0ACC0CM68_9PEZI|nr:putative hemolysin-III channel protein Izh2 [Hypoxylon rubiginosum]